MAAMEARLPGGKKTKRNPILKLELGTGDPRNQVKIVSDTVYGLADIPHMPSREYTKWRTVDESLFGDAISAYQGTIDPFKQQPRVYKIESIKEKVWEGTRDKTEENFAKEEEEYMKRKALLDARKAKMAAKKKEAIAKAEAAGGKVANPLAAKVDEGMKMMEEAEQNKELPPLTLEEQLETYLDPFEPPAPWIKEVHKGELTYLNEETMERMIAKPGTKYEELEIWRNKLQMLEQLTPREDLDGYEYRETDAERRRRQRYINDFEKSMQEEIKRREENPNDLEILEDVLFDIIDNIVQRQEKEDRAQARAEKRAIQATWHTLCNGFRMKELEFIENEEGEIEREVTDLDFADMIIGPCGHMLSLQTPPGFFEKHEKERAAKAEIDEQKRMIEEAERNKPFVDKAKIILALARNDPKAAAKKVYRGMKEKALEPIRYLRVKENRQKLSLQSKEFLLNGLKSMIQASKTPKSSAVKMAKSMYEMYKRTFFVEDTDPNQQALEDILNAIDGKEKVVEVEKDTETEEERRLRLWRASQPKPVKHANCVMVTMTFLIEPPAPWKWRKPRTWKDDVADAKEKVKETAQDIKYKLLPMIPPIVDGINDKLMAPIGQDAIELDEAKYEVPKNVLRRQATVRRPWEFREHDHMSNATAKPISHSKFVSRILGIEAAEDKEKRLAEEAEVERIRLEEEQAKEQARLALEAKKAAEVAKADEKKRKKEEKEEAKRKAREEKKRKKEESAKKANGEDADDHSSGASSGEVKTGDDGSPSKKKQKQPVAGVDFLGDTTAEGAPTDGTTGDASAGEQQGSEEEKKDGEAGDGEKEAAPLTEEERRQLLIDNVKASVLKDHINPNTLVLDDEQREEEYKAWLRKKQLLEDPEAYNRSSIKIPKLPKLTSGPIDVSLPTKAELKDKLRNSIRKAIEPVHVKDVIDASERKRFEFMLREEISEACTLPVGNIQIEEIRRLPVNDPKLIALKKRNEEYEAARIQKEKEKAEAIRADQEARKEKNNWYKYGYEEEMIYETRRFIEDYSEKKGYDPDEVVKKLGITREQLKWNRYDEMDLDQTGKFVPKGYVEPDNSPSAEEIEAKRKFELVEQLLYTHKEEDDFPVILSVYEEICDQIQSEEDAELARIEAERLARLELERQQQVREKLLETFTYESGEYVLVDLYEEMCIEVNRRDLEDKQIIRDGEEMYSEDISMRLYLVEEEYANNEAQREAEAQLAREAQRDEMEKQRLLNLTEAELKNSIRAARRQERERQLLLRSQWMETYAEHTDEESGSNDLIAVMEEMRENVFKRISMEMPLVPPAMHIEMITITPPPTITDSTTEDVNNGSNVDEKKDAVLLITNDTTHSSEVNGDNNAVEILPKPNSRDGYTDGDSTANAITNAASSGDAEGGDGFTPGQVVLFNDATKSNNQTEDSVVPPTVPIQKLVVVQSPFDTLKLVDMDTSTLNMPHDDDMVVSIPRHLMEVTKTPLPTPRDVSDIPPYDLRIVVTCMMDMLTEIDDRIYKEERAIKEEEWARQAAEHDEWLHEFNWKRHSTGGKHEQYLTYLEQRQEEHRTMSPRKPADFKLGIRNPGEIDNDPNNSIAQAVKPASQEERRRRRIKFLWQRQEQRLEGIKKVIHDYKAMKAHVIHEADHYYDENWEPLVEGIVFPVMKAVKERIKYRAKKYYNSMKQAYQEQKEKFLKMFEKPDTSHILEDTEVKKRILTIKYAIDKERKEMASEMAGTQKEPWVEPVNDEEKERRLEWRENILMSAEENGDLDMASVVTVYEQLCFKVTRQIEGYTTPYDDREELVSGMDLHESDETASGRIQQDANTEAVIDEMQEEYMKELKKQEELAAFEAERAAKAAQKDPREIEREAHAHFRRLRRHRIRDGYDEEIVDLLNKMCIAVDLSEEFEEPAIDIMDQIEDDYDQEPGKAETDSTPPSVVDEEEEKEEEEENMVVDDAEDEMEGEEEDNEPIVDDSVRGCEISFMINVTDIDRQGQGLSELEAEDIAVMLQEQILEPESKLKKGYIGSHAIDMTYKLPFQKRKFNTWEAFWVHVIHPCFFYRSTKKSVPKKSGGRKDGRLESGLIIVNPTHQFSARSKEAFLALNKRYAPKRPTAPTRRKGGKEEELDPVQKAKMEEMAKKAAKKKEKEKRVVDLQVDEFAADANKLQIVRPNYDSLTKKDVERLRRIHLAFEEKYQAEMLQGLEQPGNRLRIEQYEALKNRDAAFRIWRSAKTKLQSDARKDGTLNEGEVVMPTLKPTHIPDEQFLEWILEIKEEDHENMVARIREKAAQKVLREQEADIRKEFQKRRYWYINFCIYDASNAQELGPALHKELMFEAEKKRAALNLEMTEMELQKFETKRNEFQSYVIQEEKGTRVLFEKIARWAFTSNIYVRRKKARVLERRNTLIRLGAEHKNRLSSMDPTLTITEGEEGEEDDDNNNEGSQVTFHSKGGSTISGLSGGPQSLTGGLHGVEDQRPLSREKEAPTTYQDKATKKVSNEIAELARRSSKLIAQTGDSRKQSIQIRRGSTIIPANIVAQPIRDIIATVGVTKEGQDGIEEVKEGTTEDNNDNGSVGTVGSHGSGSGSSKGSNVSAELIAATSGTNSVGSGGRGRGRAALKPIVMPNRRNSVAIKSSEGSVLVPDNIPIEFQTEEDLDDIELADDDLNDISDDSDTDSDAEDSDSDSEDELLEKEEEEKQKGFFGLNLPRLAKNNITQFLEVFKQYKDKFEAYNAKIAEIDQRKFERDEQARREGAMLKAKLEAQQLMGMTANEVQRLLDEYWGEVSANKKVTNAMWSSEIPPLRPKLPSQLRIPQSLFRLAMGVNWLNVALASETCAKALMELPTAEETHFARDELIQYSTIVAEIDPLIKRVQTRIEKIKEEEARLRGLRVDKDKSKKVNPDGLTRKEQREKERLEKMEAASNDISTMTKDEREKLIQEKEKEMQAAGMGAEAIRRMKRAEDAKRRQGERERAWLLAHPHRFIKYNEVEPAFCITCKEKLFEQWEEKHIKEEKEHSDNFDNELMENYEDSEDKVTEEVEKDNEKRLAAIQVDIEELYAYQDGKVKDEIEFQKRWEKYEEEMLTYKKTGKKQPFPPTKRLRQAPDVSKTRIYLDKVAAIENAPPPFVPGSIHRAKLCYVDPKGENIIPPDAVGGEEISVADNDNDDDDDDDDMRSTESEPHGLRLRVWDRTDMERGPFLGYVELSTDDILRPPAGIRTYKLKTDQKLLEKQPEDIVPVDIAGTLTLQLKIIKKDKNTEAPLKWRLEIVRLNKIAYVDRLKKTSPFIEVFWCGPGIKDDVKIHYKRWLPIGNTVVKVKTTDPKFDKSKPEDCSVFEFPPVWSDLIIPDRGVEWEEVDGGWCSQNRIPSKDDQGSGNGGGKLLRLFRKAGLVALAAVKFMKNPRLKLRKEVEERLDMMRELWKAENRERVCMAKEERYRRIVDLQDEKTRAQPLLELQIDYEKKWSRLCMNISNAPKILNRLRFMMGSQADGGGTIIMCQDPATKRMLNILSVPILYPEDEENMVRHMQPLIGKQHPNLTGVIDFSVHAARQYNLHGEPSVDDRVAIAVLERYEGINLLDYMQKEWLHLTNDRFRFLLSQIISGLVALHQENIIHRNFHEKCVIVRQPKNIYDEDQNPDPDKRYMPKDPNLRLADYWFLQNPRAAGCEYSLGRADWGNRGTAPPESLMGALITDKSDVWAFGVCLYHWATGGRVLPGVFKGDDLAKDIPLKWGNWVLILLKMCLARNPEKRASAKEIHTFLSKILGN